MRTFCICYWGEYSVDIGRELSPRYFQKDLFKQGTHEVVRHALRGGDGMPVKFG